MRIFTIYFEIFGKKMKTDIAAASEEQAKNILENKIIYHKITSKSLPKNNSNDIFEYLKKYFPHINF